MKIVDRLLAWYKKEGRDLPWRKTTDPYPILVSEIMLQQTQVSRGLLYFDKWLKKFPDWKSLADATNAEVIKEWAGLGYNRRALMLRDIARQVVEKGVPETKEQWLEFKGVGPYTASALTVFSLRQRAMPIDTNIRRVVGRLFLRKHYPDLKNDEVISEVGTHELMNSDNFIDVPQALFDLATIHCVKKPDCSACPMKDLCASSEDFISGKVEPPKRMTKKVNETIHRNKKYPDRIFRGRILKLVREGEGVDFDKIGAAIDDSFDHALDTEWLEAMISRLIKDKMIEYRNSELHLVD